MKAWKIILTRINGKSLVIRFEIWLVSLAPTNGSEITKTGPCVIISPDSINNNLNTVIIAPLTHTLKNYPTRINFVFNNQTSQIALDHIRTIDKKERLVKKVGELSKPMAVALAQMLIELFEY